MTTPSPTRLPSVAKRILAIFAESRTPDITLGQLACSATLHNTLFKLVARAATALVAKGELIHRSAAGTDVYTLPETPEPEDQFTAPKVDKTKPVRKKAKAKAKREPGWRLAPVVPGLMDNLDPVVHTTREAWLLAAVGAVRPLFDAQGADAYPPLRISCGWPKGGTFIGECWPRSRSEDNTVEIFISPGLIDGVKILTVLVHELIHALDDCSHGHRGPFKKLSLAIGLEGKVTETHAGPALEASLRLILGKLGPYPHAKLDASKAQKQRTRMLKVVCVDTDCGYTLRTTAKWLAVGLPTCFCGSHMEAK